MPLTTKFMLGDTTVDVVKVDNERLTDKLPPQVYALQYGEFRGFYLSIIKERLVVPEKIYGNVFTRADKCLNTYQSRTQSTGILMTGDKGTGKTLLMSVLANRAVAELGIPVILIREAYQGDQFMSFIELIGECCLVFDEFGKTYRQRNNQDDGAKQTSLLGLLDGVDKTKRLIIMTENSRYDINDFMLNRPSRVYYHFEYKKLDEESILDFCQDRGVTAANTEVIADLSRTSRIFSFDMLQTIVEEHLRYPDESINDVIRELNIEIEQDEIPEIEILRAVSQDGREYEVIGSSIVNKPNRRNSVPLTFIDQEIYKEHPELRNALPEDLLPEEVGEKIESTLDEMACLAITLSQGEVKYEGKGKIIYETDYGLRVVTRELPRVRRYNWNDLF